MVALYERFRPTALVELVGQEPPIKAMRRMQDDGGWGGRVFLITGPSGSGKTTLARIVAADVSEPYATHEIDAQDVTMELCRQWEDWFVTRPIGTKPTHCVIVNECHGLSTKVVSRLQTTLELPHIQRTSTWCFTTTNKGQRKLFDEKFDGMPFLSRAIHIRLSKPNEMAVALHLRGIAQQLDLDGQPLEAYIALAKRCECNFRAALNAIEGGEMLS
jgi:replication-associated recombination protein RarA